MGGVIRLITVIGLVGIVRLVGAGLARRGRYDGAVRVATVTTVLAGTVLTVCGLCRGSTECHHRGQDPEDEQ
jgi:hypothetical protein